MFIPTEVTGAEGEVAEVGCLFSFSKAPNIIHLGMNRRKIAQRVIGASLKGGIDAFDQVWVLGLTSCSEGF